MIAFTAITAVGGVLLLVALLFDGVFDAFDVDFGASGLFSGASLAGFITGFGLGGIIGTAQGWKVLPSAAIGVLVGLAIAAVAVVIYRWLKRSEAPTAELSSETLVGQTGLVTAGAQPGKTGLVRGTYLGAPRTLSFVADVAIDSGTIVTITEVLGPDTVKVAPPQAPAAPTA
ncbi:MAG: hypothetical protein LBR27_07155 [Bifidobacteriaceae bacterium]|jgi:hypothetical protein|nr:hypothetical protein [Bifidobacteriaceae bacterium]